MVSQEFDAHHEAARQDDFAALMSACLTKGLFKLSSE